MMIKAIKEKRGRNVAVDRSEFLLTLEVSRRRHGGRIANSAVLAGVPPAAKRYCSPRNSQWSEDPEELPRGELLSR